MGQFEADGFDKKEYQSVVLAALLHDIGKLIHRENAGSYKISHHKTGALFVEQMAEKLRNDSLYDLDLVTFLIKHHHPIEAGATRKDLMKDHYVETLSPDGKQRAWKLLALVKIADTYSCSERDQNEELRKNFAYRLEPLRSTFANIRLKGRQPSEDVCNYQPLELHPSTSFPECITAFKDQELTELTSLMKKRVPDFSCFNEFNHVVNEWLDILQAYTWAVPSDTRYDSPDVSLFDHLRSSSAFAACLYKRHISSIVNKMNRNRRNEFILVGGDYSGIQDYIFHVTNRGSGGAARRLRSRSFFISLFTEATIHKILDMLNLPFVCNLFSAGGKFLLLVPNIDGVIRTLEEAKTQIESEIARNYFNQFAFLLSWMEVNACTGRRSTNEFKVYNFFETADRMFHRLESQKLRKHSSVLVNAKSATWNTEAFKATAMYEQYKDTGDCKICGRGPGTILEKVKETDETIAVCPICHQDGQVGQRLPKTEFVGFGRFSNQFFDDTARRVLIFEPVTATNGDFDTPGYYVDLLDKPEKRTEHYLIYSLDRDNTEGSVYHLPIVKKYYANHVPTEENGDVSSFEVIAGKSFWKRDDKKKYGSDLLGVLKADIDNLGLVFSKGFERSRETGEGVVDLDKKTVSRFLTLSRMTELFFSGWIKAALKADTETVIAELCQILEVPNPAMEEYLRKALIDFQDIYTVYSGGDDLVLIGPWEKMIVFSIYLNRKFRKYTADNESITLSAGLYLTKARTPIASAIKMADNYLNRSKEEGKNRITLLESTVKWEQLPGLIDFFLFFHEKVNDPISTIKTAFLNRLYDYHLMAAQYVDTGRTSDLRYLSLLSYDVGRNIVRWSEYGKITRGIEEYSVLQSLIGGKLDAESLLYNLKIPLLWALYRNRSVQAYEYPNHI